MYSLTQSTTAITYEFLNMTELNSVVTMLNKEKKKKN